MNPESPATPAPCPPPCPLLIGTLAVCGSTLRVRWDDDKAGLHGWFCQSCGNFEPDPIPEEKEQEGEK